MAIYFGHMRSYQSWRDVLNLTPSDITFPPYLIKGEARDQIVEILLNVLGGNWADYFYPEYPCALLGKCYGHDADPGSMHMKKIQDRCWNNRELALDPLYGFDMNWAGEPIPEILWVWLYDFMVNVPYVEVSEDGATLWVGEVGTDDGCP